MKKLIKSLESRSSRITMRKATCRTSKRTSRSEWPIETAEISHTVVKSLLMDSTRAGMSCPLMTPDASGTRSIPPHVKLAVTPVESILLKTISIRS